MNSSATFAVRFESIVLQICHRIAVASFLALMIAWAMLVRSLSDPSHAAALKSYRYLFATAFAGGNLAIATGVLAMAMAHRRGARLREARGVIIWGLVLVLLALPVLVLAKLELMKL